MTMQSFPALDTASNLHFKPPMKHLHRKFKLILGDYLFHDNVTALACCTTVRKGSRINFINPFGNGATIVFAIILSRVAGGQLGACLGLIPGKRTGLAMLIP